MSAAGGGGAQGEEGGGGRQLRGERFLAEQGPYGRERCAGAGIEGGSFYNNRFHNISTSLQNSFCESHGD